MKQNPYEKGREVTGVYSGVGRERETVSVQREKERERERERRGREGERELFLFLGKFCETKRPNKDQFRQNSNIQY